MPAAPGSPRTAGISSRRQPDVARQRRPGGRFPPREDRQSAVHPPSGAINRPASASIRLHQPPAGGSQRRRQPDQARSALRPAFAMGQARPHGLLSAHRPADHGLRHAISAPSDPRRLPLAWCERAVCRQSRIAQGPPGTPPPTPCEFPPTPGKGETPTAPPCGARCKDLGGTEKIQENGKTGVGEVRQGPGSEAGWTTPRILAIPGPAVRVWTPSTMGSVRQMGPSRRARRTCRGRRR